MAELRNSYLLSLTEGTAFVPWEPPRMPEGMALPDPIYFGPALAEMDRRLQASGLTFYMTQDLERLPSYGMDVVVLLIGDEFTRVPAYFDRVLAIFKNHAVRPALTTSVFSEPSWLNFWWLVAYARTVAHHAPGLRSYRRRRRAGGWAAPIWRVPVGTGNQLDLPLKPLGERTTDLFFAGSILHRPGVASELREKLGPKTIARESMLREAEALAARRADLSVEMVITREFVDSIVGERAASYSEQMMDSKIALVPRGTAPDTYRLWQALRCGTITVVDTMPRDRHFYDDAPVVRLNRWDQLEETVMPILEDESRMRELHERSLNWWRTRGSAEAVGSFMAQKLDELEP